MIIINGLLGDNMSLQSALDLLNVANSVIEIKKGPFDQGGHALMVENGNLILVLNTGIIFKKFLLDNNDLLKDPQDLMLEIMALLDSDHIKNKKDMN